ncbi:hypothetical protein [Nonomuraea sp. NPDC050783]|uniref:hypothetical protein n=1 Tax=Nonomuraea sp. NPDC050783 TaxID=3154634 RepID=UPI0034665C42
MKWIRMPLVAVLAVAVIGGCASDGGRPAASATRPAAGEGASGQPGSQAGEQSGSQPGEQSSRPAGEQSSRPAGEQSGRPEAGATASPAATVTGAGCGGTPVLSGGGFLEVRGAGDGVELWGLLFAKGPLPLRHGEEVKIVWRMTGDGPLRQVRATLPDGTRAKLAWGPEEHSGSNWPRPGQEWGTGFVFPERGCWKVELARDRGRGHAWLLVR